MKRSPEQQLAKLIAKEPQTARRYWREQLALILKHWRPLKVLNVGNDVVRLMRDDGGYDEMNLGEMRKEMPTEHYILVRTLLRLLAEQTDAARNAVLVANEALTLQTKRKLGGSKTAKERKQERLDRIDRLRAETTKLIKAEGAIKGEAVAAVLADRGLGGKAALLKLLRNKKS